MNKNLRKAMISAICMLIVGVMSLTGVTYAWFTSSDAATVTGMTFDVYAPVGGVLISKDHNTNFGYELELKDAHFENFIPTSTAPSTLLGGELKFFTAEVNTNPGDLGEVPNVIKTSAVGNEAYFAQTLYLYNDGVDPITVNLGGTTIGFNTAADADDNNNAEWAMRLALVKHGQYVPGEVAPAPTGKEGVVIYEPNASSHIDGTVAGQQSYNGIKASSTPAWFDGTVEGDYCESVETVVNATDVSIEIPGLSYYAVTVYIWLEGQDVDCRNAIGGSKLEAALNFTVVSSKTEN